MHAQLHAHAAYTIKQKTTPLRWDRGCRNSLWHRVVRTEHDAIGVAKTPRDHLCGLERVWTSSAPYVAVCHSWAKRLVCMRMLQFAAQIKMATCRSSASTGFTHYHPITIETSFVKRAASILPQAKCSTGKDHVYYNPASLEPRAVAPTIRVDAGTSPQSDVRKRSRTRGVTGKRSWSALGNGRSE